MLDAMMAGAGALGSESEASNTQCTTQFRFSEEQRKTLTEYWENGMQTCSKSITAMIKECATNAGCTVEQVMVS